MSNRRAPKSLRVFYDEHCPFCLKFVEALSREPTYSPISFLPMNESAQLKEFQQIAPHISSGRFVVLDDQNQLYLDTKARLMILYMTKRYRLLSLSLSAPGIHSLVGVVFSAIANNRQILSHLLFGSRQKNFLKDCSEHSCRIEGKHDVA